MKLTISRVTTWYVELEDTGISSSKKSLDSREGLVRVARRGILDLTKRGGDTKIADLMAAACKPSAGSEDITAQLKAEP